MSETRQHLKKEKLRIQKKLNRVVLKLNELPPHILMLVCQNLTIKETARLTLTSR